MIEWNYRWNPPMLIESRNTFLLGIRVLPSSDVVSRHFSGSPENSYETYCTPETSCRWRMTKSPIHGRSPNRNIVLSPRKCLIILNV